MNVLAGCDLFTVEVLSWRGLVTYYVLFFIHLESRRVQIAGITRHPDQEWIEQIGRSATQETLGYLQPCRYVLHDRDYEVLCLVSVGARQRRRYDNSTAGQEPESEMRSQERWIRSVKLSACPT